MPSVRQVGRCGVLVLLSALYFAGLTLPAAAKLFWFDEIITVSVAKLPRLSMLWSALVQGADNNPPLYHLAVRASFALFGEGELPARLPAMLGVWVLMICLYRFVARRCGPSYGWAAMLIPLSTAATAFAYEARPYGLVLGCTGAALVCWQSAAEGGPRRWAWLAGLALSLAAGVTSHYYAVLLPVPLAAGELVRTAGRRKLDPWIWLALALGMVPLAGLYPLTKVLREVFMPGFWARPEVLSIPRAYGFLFEHALPALAVALAAFGLARRRWPAEAVADGPDAAGRPTFPAHEVAAASVLLAMPFYALALALLATGVLADRYVLPAIAGFAILLPFAAHRLGGGRASWGLFLAACFLVSAPLCEIWNRGTLRRDYLVPRLLYHPILLMPDETLPVAVSDHLRYAQLIYYAPRALLPRLAYVHMGYRTPDKNLVALSRWTGLDVVSLKDYTDRQGGARFLLYGRMNDEPLISLVLSGARVEAQYLDHEIFIATVDKR